MTAVREKIQKILDEKINAQLQLHNGSAQLTYVEDGVAAIKFLGACASCVSSSDTFETIVRKSIMEEVPEITDVVIDDTISEDLLAMARKILNKEI